jgi:hypothetical protein
MLIAPANPTQPIPASELLGRGRFVGSGQVQGRVGSACGSPRVGATRDPGSGVIANPLLEGDRAPCSDLARGSGRWTDSHPWVGCRAAGRFRRRWDVFDGSGGAGGVGWRLAGHQPGGSAANPPHGPPDDAPGTAGPGWPDQSGHHAASAADDGPHTRPGAVGSRGRHSRRRAQPGRCVGRSGRPGWPGPPPAAGWVRHPGPEATAPSPSAAAPPAPPHPDLGPPVLHPGSGPRSAVVDPCSGLEPPVARRGSGLGPAGRRWRWGRGRGGGGRGTGG